MMENADRLIGIAAAVYGAAGVAAMAAGSHALAGTHVDLAGLMLVMHAAALLALMNPALGIVRARRLAALMIVVGVGLFAGDIVCRALAGARLFPMAAPSGGLATMAGWLVAGVGFAFDRR